MWASPGHSSSASSASGRNPVNRDHRNDDGYSHRVIGLLYRMRATAKNKKQYEAIMFTRMTADGRLLGFDIGDWSMLFGGCMLAGLLAFLL
jgi:hypothetical protein